MDMSLDEIIKKNNFKRGSQNSRGRSQSSPGARRGTGNKPLNGRINKQQARRPSQSEKSRGAFTNTNSRVTDARLKIIQKNRMRLTDARDKLSELAKKTDARLRIKGRNSSVNQRVDRVDRRQDRGGLTRSNYSRPSIQTAPVLLQRSIRNNAPRPNMRGADSNSLIRRTINRSMSDMSMRSSGMYLEDEDMVLPMRPRNDLSNIKVVTQNEYTQYNQVSEYENNGALCYESSKQNWGYLPSMPEPMYVDDYDQPSFTRQLEPQRGYPLTRNSGARMSLEMRARLDSPAKPTSMYSYPPPAHSPPLSEGHRIVVSNLHSSVTHEDIKELFEDIGPLFASRLVRPGTAEVIYKLQKDAKKAVEAYHNRQLDGQPMKCLLVNPRSPTGAGGVLRSSNMPTIPKFPSSSKSMVIPDLSAIHKALFMSK